MKQFALLHEALKYYGTTEYKGRNHNPVIINMFHELGFKYINDDETPWCSAFMNYCCLKTGLQITNSLKARSFENWGMKLIEPIEKPKLGDIVVLWRGSIDSDSGHVGLFINESTNYIKVLGGNQADMVKISTYNKKFILSYNRP